MLFCKKFYYRPNFIALFCILMFAGLPGYAQIADIPDSMSQTGLGGQNSIIGTVFGPSGRPLENRVRIRLSTMTSGDRISTSNETGSFAFRGLPTGTYTVLIEKEVDYKPFSQSVDLRQFRGAPPQVYTMNIRLESKERSDAKPGVVNAQFANISQAARTKYERALELAKTGDHLGAIEQLRLAVQEDPKFMLAHNELGVQYLRINQLEDADLAFQRVLKIEPTASGALTNRGIANVMMKRYGEAVPFLRKALLNNDKSAVGHYFLGQALANLGLFDDAEKELHAALNLNGDEMKEAHRILAIIYISKGEKSKAAAELESFLRLTPDAPDADKIRESITKLKMADKPN